MYPLPQISDAPYQQAKVVLQDGSAVQLQLRYRPNQFGWYLESLAWKTFTVTGMRIGANPNILQQYANQIPFGLACFTTTGRDPTLQQDFSSGAFTLNILTPAEVAEYAGYLAGE